jgi:hypothetical protein
MDTTMLCSLCSAPDGVQRTVKQVLHMEYCVVEADIVERSIEICFLNQGCDEMRDLACNHPKYYGSRTICFIWSSLAQKPHSEFG